MGKPTDGESHAVSYPPAIVVYIVDPFSYEDAERGARSSAHTLGLLCCYMEMLKLLPARIRNAVSVQVGFGHGSLPVSRVGSRSCRHCWLTISKRETGLTTHFASV